MPQRLLLSDSLLPMAPTPWRTAPPLKLRARVLREGAPADAPDDVRYVWAEAVFDVISPDHQKRARLLLVCGGTLLGFPLIYLGLFVLKVDWLGETAKQLTAFASSAIGVVVIQTIVRRFAKGLPDFGVSARIPRAVALLVVLAMFDLLGPRWLMVHVYSLRPVQLSGGTAQLTVPKGFSVQYARTALLKEPGPINDNCDAPNCVSGTPGCTVDSPNDPILKVLGVRQVAFGCLEQYALDDGKVKVRDATKECTPVASVFEITGKRYVPPPIPLCSGQDPAASSNAVAEIPRGLPSKDGPSLTPMCLDSSRQVSISWGGDSSGLHSLNWLWPAEAVGPARFGLPVVDGAITMKITAANHHSALSCTNAANNVCRYIHTLTMTAPVQELASASSKWTADDTKLSHLSAFICGTCSDKKPNPLEEQSLAVTLFREPIPGQRLDFPPMSGDFKVTFRRDAKVIGDLSCKAGASVRAIYVAATMKPRLGLDVGAQSSWLAAEPAPGAWICAATSASPPHVEVSLLEGHQITRAVWDTQNNTVTPEASPVNASTCNFYVDGTGRHPCKKCKQGVKRNNIDGCLTAWVCDSCE